MRMVRNVAALAVGCAFCLTAAVQATRWTPPPEPPPEVAARIAEAGSTGELESYLESQEESVRIAAVRRIAEIADEQAVDVICAAFGREPAAFASLPQRVKDAMLLALGQIGGDDAKAFVLATLERYVQKGPKASRYIYHDGDYFSVVSAAIAAVARRWHSVPEVHRRLREIALEGDAHKFFYSMREQAYQGLLLEEMRRRELTTLEQRAVYLLKRLTGIGMGHMDDWLQEEPGGKTLPAISNSATVALLVELDEAAVPYVQEELQATPEDQVRRIEALEYVLHSIDPEKYQFRLRGWPPWQQEAHE